MGDFVQTVLYNVLGNKEENTKEKDLEEITDASYPQSMEATPLSSADADFIKKLDQIIFSISLLVGTILICTKCYSLFCIGWNATD